MCGIAGFANPFGNYMEEEGRWRKVLEDMNRSLKHRGPDDEGTLLSHRCGMAHVRLSIIDLKTGHQPMSARKGAGICSIVYNGEIYNMKELKKGLQEQGARFATSSDTEVILQGFVREGADYVKKLNGIFSIAIWDEEEEALYLFRDRLGVKPLFYCFQDDALIFASELKGLFCFPGVEPVVDQEGLCEIFALGPAKSYGKGVFRGVREVLAGHFLRWSKKSFRDEAYWELESHPHEDSMEETVEKTSFLIHDAVKKQMLSDIPISTFLSGGVDSSLVTAICAKELEREGKQLNTFSFDFKDNGKYFKSNAFQPSQDRPWVERMADFAKTNHRYLECENTKLADYLYQAVDARDLPCMADVESSLLYFCSQVVNYNKVTLTGECADEIFGGYPWFHKREMWESNAFPWSVSMEPRQVLLKDEVISQLPMEEYARAAYEKTILEVPRLYGEKEEEARRREISYLNLKWFMVTLLDRMDRTSMYSGLEARVPLADHRIVEYLWNVPWRMKCPNGVVKGLLRMAGEEDLPAEVLYRKKSPYPKTYDPAYEKLLGERLLEVMADPNEPIQTLVDKKKVLAFIQSPSDYGKPWYGQLMAGPQMLAFMLQVNYWLKRYRIRLV